MLSNDTIQHLIAITEEDAPNEMCGLLFSRESHCVFTWCENRHADPTAGFVIDHEKYLDACHEAGELPWAIVHSHPVAGAGPSVKDCQLMDALQIAGQDLSMVIVGLQPVEIRVFKKDGDLYHLEWAWTVGRLEEYARNL